MPDFYPGLIKYLSIFAVVILVSIVFNGVVMKAYGEVVGTSPPDIGDWIIADETTIKNETIILNGNSILKMNCTSDGEYKIQVNNSGKMNILWSTVQNGSSDHNFDWYFLGGSCGIISNSTISHVGYSGSGSQGIKIESSNVTIYQNSFINSYNGLWINNSSPEVISNTFKSNDNDGILWEGGDLFWQDSFVDMNGVSSSSNVVQEGDYIRLCLDENSPLDSTIGLYHLNEGEGTVAVDSSGNNNDGTLCNFGIPWNTDSRFGDYGLYFQGTDDYIDFGDNFDTADGSIDLWLKLTDNFSSASSSHKYLFEKKNGNYSRFRRYCDTLF